MAQVWLALRRGGGVAADVAGGSVTGRACAGSVADGDPPGAVAAASFLVGAANTPWYDVKCIRGGGISRATRASRISGVITSLENVLSESLARRERNS